ncbi:MAG: type I-E CRISPR-associated protein Cas5/CasD, partial [Propionibacteriaceae bacterium]|nr:type I-E CRISPR-associated protein Cas5/CasD [Propionibacteriaceae bacterium]
LQDVRYRIHAHVRLRRHATDPVAKYRDQFRRRVERGACFTQPYLGTREFTALFGPPSDATAIPVTDDLGVMLHSIGFASNGGNPTSTWFLASLEQGVLRVPEHGLKVGDEP